MDTVATFQRIASEASQGMQDPKSIGMDTRDGVAVYIATWYAGACQRVNAWHHPEESPAECLEAGPETDAIQAAHDAMWEAIGWSGPKETDADNLRRYHLAWAVWGAFMDHDNA